jgi:hypothetical protein
MDSHTKSKKKTAYDDGSHNILKTGLKAVSVADPIKLYFFAIEEFFCS